MNRWDAGSRWAVAAAAFVGMVAAGTVARAQTDYFVDAAQPDDTGNGLSWGTAKKTIQAAVDLTSDNDTVWVTNGTYDITAQITINKAIAVRGFSGDPADTIVQRTGSGSHRIFYVDHEDAVLEGLTIRNGFGVNGAGVYGVKGTIRRCVIRDNWHNAAISGIGTYLVGAGAVMDECLVVNNYNTAGSGNNRGGGIYAGSTAALISNSVIVSNRLNFGATKHGGGVRGGTLRNCLIAFNSAGQSGGGAYESILENCTVTQNTAQQGGGGVSACTVRNSIVFDNVSIPYPLNPDWIGGTFVNSCTTPLPTGTGNTDADPRFRLAAAGNFRLLPASPCIGAGNNVWVLPGAKDLDGNERIMPAEGTVDMGCFEYAPGGLLGVFTADARSGLAPLAVQFTTTTDGTNTSGLVYYWDLDGDGNYDQVGTDKASVSINYPTPGFYTVSLLVSNAVGETHLLTRTDYITVSPAVLYVRPGGSHTMPYDNWDRAATDIHAAVALAAGGAEVLVSNHTYAITSQIVIERGMTVRGVNGADVTIVDGGNATRGFLLNHPDAVLHGFTVRNCNPGQPGAPGSGVLVAQGLVENCVIANNQVRGRGAIHVVTGTVRDSTIRDNVVGEAFLGCGVYLQGAGAILERCEVIRNTTTSTSGNNRGAGVYAASTAALIVNCTIVSNRLDHGASKHGGGVHGGTVRSSLIAFNVADGNGGGAHQSILENCTVANNTAVLGTGGGVNGCTLINSIVYDNVCVPSPATANWTGGSATYSCTTPLPSGAGNLDDIPGFADAAAGNFRLLAGSPCRDAGLNQAWMHGAFDLDGAPRIEPEGGVVDMGCYEFAVGDGLACDFTADVTAGLTPLTVTFNAMVEGNLDGLYYRWDLNGDGITDEEGADKAVVNRIYTSGIYSVTLVVSNAAGATDTLTRGAYVRVSPPVLYVSTNGGHEMPFDTWARAATNLHAALELAAAGAVVVVSNGTYALTSSVVLDKGVIVRGVAGDLNGAEQTIIERSATAGNMRVFYVDHPDAVLQGLTIRNGRNVQLGSGVHCVRGTIRHCVIRDNQAGINSMRGIGVYLAGAGAVLEYSTVMNNVSMSINGYNYGAGVGAGSAEALVQNCTIVSNRMEHGVGTPAGGGVYLARVQNSLLAYNAAIGGGGAYQSVLENCTVAGNTVTTGTGGGVNGCTLLNSIVYFNAAPNNPSTANWSGGTFAYSCATPLPAGTGNIENDPLFKDPSAGDYTLEPGSPCINAGLNQPWMEGALDLAGNARRIGASVDMGAYEFAGARGTVIMLR